PPPRGYSQGSGGRTGGRGHPGARPARPGSTPPAAGSPVARSAAGPWAPTWCRRGPETCDPFRPRRHRHGLCGEPLFYPGPIPAQPRRNQGLVPLGGARTGSLRTPTAGVQGSAERVAVIPHPERLLDHLGNARECPALGLEPGDDSPPLEHVEQVAPLGRAQRGRPTGRPAPLETLQPVVVQPLL